MTGLDAITALFSNVFNADARSGGELSAAGGGLAVRSGGRGADAIDLRVLFSYAFFFEGFTGLAVTIGAILTLFVVMQMTGRLRWEEKFSLALAGNGRVMA